MTATRAGQAIITQDPKQRPLYALGQTVSDALVSAFVSVVVTSNLIGSMQEPFVWRISIVVMSVVSIVFVLLAAKAISNRDNPTYYSMNQKKREETKITEFFSLIRRSKPLRSLLWATCSDSIAKSVRASLSIYLFANIIMNRGLTSAFDILNGVVLGAPVLVVGMYFASKKGLCKSLSQGFNHSDSCFCGRIFCNACFTSCKSRTYLQWYYFLGYNGNSYFRFLYEYPGYFNKP